MGKRLAISILALFISCDALAAPSARKSLLRDGFVLAGVDGNLTSKDSNETWFFESDSDLSDNKGRAKAGESLELLPSATLEKMADDAQKRSETSYRLWGKVTKYKGTNFIFPIYFLPLSKVKRTEPPTTQKSQQREPEITINEPNDVLAIPNEIVAKLKTKQIIRTELKKGLELKQDSILADRTGFIRDSEHGVSFVLDALGRNLQQISFPLLPCRALERAQRKQSAQADPLRFKIAGIVTEYKGEHYLLLQRATRVYSHQNFPR